MSQVLKVSDNSGTFVFSSGASGGLTQLNLKGLPPLKIIQEDTPLVKLSSSKSPDIELISLGVISTVNSGTSFSSEFLPFPDLMDDLQVEKFYMAWYIGETGWLIRYQTRDSTEIFDATQDNNPDYEDLMAAWDVRDSLSYIRI